MLVAYINSCFIIIRQNFLNRTYLIQSQLWQCDYVIIVNKFTISTCQCCNCFQTINWYINVWEHQRGNKNGQSRGTRNTDTGRGQIKQNTHTTIHKQTQIITILGYWIKDYQFRVDIRQNQQKGLMEYTIPLFRHLLATRLNVEWLLLYSWNY